VDALHVRSDGRCDVIDVIRDGARVAHDRIDVAVNPLEELIHPAIALSKIPCGWYRGNHEDANGDCQQTAGNPGNALEGARYGRNLLREHCVRQCRTALDEPYARPRHRLEHRRVSVKIA